MGKMIVFGWYGGKYSHLDWLLPLLPPQLTSAMCSVGQMPCCSTVRPAAFPASSLADLYDRLTMPPILREAHQNLDAAVDSLYRPQPFADDRERAEHLLTRSFSGSDFCTGTVRIRAS